MKTRSREVRRIESNWVEDIIKDGMLANDLQKATNRAQAAKLVANRIAILSKKVV